MEYLISAAVLDNRAGHNDGILDIDVFADFDGIGNYAVFDGAVDDRAFADETVDNVARRRDVVRRLCVVARVDFPLVVVKVKFLAFENVHIGFPQRRNRADVLPVAVKLIGVHPLTVRKHFRDDVFAEVVFAVLVVFVLDKIFAKFVPREYVYTHRRLRAFRILWLFLEFFYLFAVLFEIEDAKAACFLDRYVAHCDSAVCIVALMLFEHVVIIHLIDVVTAQNDDVIGAVIVDKVYVLVNCIRRALVPLARLCAHIRRQNVDTAAESVQIPRLTVADVLVKFEGAILRKHADGVDAAVDAV